MNAHEHHGSDGGHRPRRRSQHKQAEFLARVVRMLFGALVGTALTSLFSLLIFAFIVKAFITSDEMSFQLLNTAITLVGTTLGAVLGYFLGRNSNDGTGGGA